MFSERINNYPPVIITWAGVGAIIGAVVGAVLYYYYNSPPTDSAPIRLSITLEELLFSYPPDDMDLGPVLNPPDTEVLGNHYPPPYSGG